MTINIIIYNNKKNNNSVPYSQYYYYYFLQIKQTFFFAKAPLDSPPSNFCQFEVTNGLTFMYIVVIV